MVGINISSLDSIQFENDENRIYNNQSNLVARAVRHISS